METKTKKILYYIWYPFGIVIFIVLLIYGFVGLLLQPLVGINSYLYNWKSDRNLKEEIISAKLFA